MYAGGGKYRQEGTRQREEDRILLEIAGDRSKESDLLNGQLSFPAGGGVGQRIQPVVYGVWWASDKEQWCVGLCVRVVCSCVLLCVVMNEKKTCILWLDSIF